MLSTPRLDDAGAPMGYRPLVLNSNCSAIGYGWWTTAVPSTVKTSQHLRADVVFTSPSRRFAAVAFAGNTFGRGQFMCDDGQHLGEVVCQAPFPCGAMVLSKHVDADKILKQVNEVTQDSSKSERLAYEKSLTSRPPFASRYAAKEEIPRFQLPEAGVEDVAAHELITSELKLDGIPALNLASFVDTWMEREADRLMQENLAKNLADADEYPSLMAIQSRCISMIADLWHAQPGEQAVGSATTGSSEAVLLCGLAMKRRWQEARRARGKDTLHPNVIMGANAQVALPKFARYFEVENRTIPVCEESRFRIDTRLIRDRIDENTIGVFLILGSTYTGHYEPVEEVSHLLDQVQAEHGWDIPIHVDAASGGFVAPFADAKAGGKKWDFELPRVVSINASGHKYGLVYPGIGWAIWRDTRYLPKHLVFELDYLGGTEETFTLNFSRPGAQVIGQYYNFIRLGFKGYQAAVEGCLENARLLSKGLEKTGWFVVISDIHREKGRFDYVPPDAQQPLMPKASSASYNEGLPVVTFRFTDDFQKKFPHVKQGGLSMLLRMKGYIIPNYALPESLHDVMILRIVIRESMSRDLIQNLLSDIVAATEHMLNSDAADLMSLGDQDNAHQMLRTAQRMGEGIDGKQSEQAQPDDASQDAKTKFHTSVC
ncbi:hypothetical protein KEM52_005364 [Ascosphaera acerosa]|nr:hypothetical protein KEM52_005364 [Ascosphaera acerosa]